MPTRRVGLIGPWLHRKASGYLKESEYGSNKQLHADMEELSDSLCLLLRHGPFSAKDLRHPALGADYGPKIFGG
jgi:hypothetical protein